MRSQCFRMALIVVLVFLLGFAPQAAGNSLEVSSVVENNVQDFPSSWIEGRHELEVSPSVELQDVEPPSRSKHPFTEEGSPFGLSVPLDEERWRAPRNPREVEDASIKIQNSGGPDDFGYTWDDTAPFNWVDAKALGVNTGITGDDETGLVDIGFSFPFYEQTWSQVYVSTNGLLLFGVDDPTDGWGSSPPSTNSPNNLIEPFWDDLFVEGNSTAIYVLWGGSAPNRYCVVEWYRVTASSGSTNYSTFEVILYENGDILMQYQDVDNDLWYRVTGIEDSLGTDGLVCTDAVKDNTAIRFYRPASSARVNIYSLYQGSFTHAGEYMTFQVPIRNTGTLGADTYDIVVTSAWSYFLFVNGALLADTDGDTIEDTGPIPQGGVVTVTVKLQTPGDVTVGDHHTFELRVISSRDTSREKTSLIRTAVPAPFVQAYWDSVDGIARLEMVQPVAHAAKKVAERSGDEAVAETLNGHFIYAWLKYRDCGQWVREIEYVLLDHAGRVIKPISKLTDHTGVTVDTVDFDPVVAVSPDGHIGFVWTQQLTNNGQENYNIYFALLDSSGKLVYEPTNLTRNDTWGTWSDSSFLYLFGPQIAATTDNHFVLSWQRSLSSYDIYYAVRNGSGGEVKPPTQFTQGLNPALTNLSNGRVLLAFQWGDIYYGVLNSTGNVVKEITNLSEGGGADYNLSPDAVQLSNGKIVVGWPCEWSTNTRVCAAVLNSSYTRVAGPVVLDSPHPMPAEGFGTHSISITADAAGCAVLTWMDWNSSRHLYYALLDGNAVQVTPSMIFHTAARGMVSVNSLGYANAPYSWVPPTSADGWVSAPAWSKGEPDGEIGLHVAYGNTGGQPALDTVLTVTLGSELEYLWASPSPIFVTASKSALDGETLVWDLPDLGFLDEGKVSLYAAVPDAPLGTTYPVTLTLRSSSVEANQADNSIVVEVQVMSHLYLPIVMRD